MKGRIWKLLRTYTRYTAPDPTMMNSSLKMEGGTDLISENMHSKSYEMRPSLLSTVTTPYLACLAINSECGVLPTLYSGLV